MKDAVEENILGQSVGHLKVSGTQFSGNSPHGQDLTIFGGSDGIAAVFLHEYTGVLVRVIEQQAIIQEGRQR